MIFRDDNTETSKDSKEEEPTKITPFHVENKNKKAINYDHVIELFGCLKIQHSLFEEFSRITGKKLHRFMRRELCYAHRDFNVLLKHVEEGKKVYLYTGRGPSSKSLHLGHCLPFILCVYFQKIFKCHVVIQITDDEKYLYKDFIKSREQIKEYAIENIKDIIAFGFDPKLTFIFMNSESMPILIENYLRICKVTKVSEILPVFGFDDKLTNIGMISFPALQMAPAYASTFDFLDKDALCLIPCAIDQDPYFRLVRDKAVILKEKKPTSLYVKLLPDLCGHHKKMSSSTDSTPIF
ncbi:SYW [Hepatospora eriocheir]|nr:SYW [Hepatospora eriocheir]